MYDELPQVCLFGDYFSGGGPGVGAASAAAAAAAGGNEKLQEMAGNFAPRPLSRLGNVSKSFPFLFPAPSK